MGVGYLPRGRVCPWLGWVLCLLHQAHPPPLIVLLSALEAGQCGSGYRLALAHGKPNTASARSSEGERRVRSGFPFPRLLPCEVTLDEM